MWKGTVKCNERKEQQIQWLTELYPTFERVAQAIIVDSVTVAEEAVSNSVEKMLKSINKGKCRADTLRKFAAWARKAVRNAARDTAATFNGDVRVDHGAKRAAFAMRPDRRRTKIPDLEAFDGEFDPYTRVETIKVPENE